MLISRPIQSTSIKIGKIKCSDFFFFLYLSSWSTDAFSETHTQETRQVPCYFSLRRNMTQSFTSFSIEDILSGRDVRGRGGEMSTRGHRASRPAAGNLCADIKTRNFSFGVFQQERPSDILSGSSEEATTISNAKGERQIRRLIIVVVFSLASNQTLFGL